MTVLQRIQAFMQTIKRELQVYQLLLRDPRTPRRAKITLGLAVGYLLMPFDLIPDAIPVLGQLDDLLIVPGLVWLSLRLIPPELVAEARAKIAADFSPSLPGGEGSERPEQAGSKV